MADNTQPVVAPVTPLATNTATPVAPVATPVPTAQPLSTNQVFYNSATPQQVYAAPNIQQATTAPAAKPNLADPFGLYDFYFSSPEMKAAKDKITGMTNQLGQFDTATDTLNTQIMNQPLSMNVLRGEQATANEQRTNQRNAISRELLAHQSYLDTLSTDASNRYSIALTERENLQDLIRQTGGKAKISYADSYESAVSKASKYLDKKAEDDAVKTLFANTFGYIPDKMSTKKMKKKLKRNYESEKEYEEQLRSYELENKRLNNEALVSTIRKASGALGAGQSQSVAAVNAAQKAVGNDWGKMATWLQNNNYDISSGSEIDNELRRRNGLDPIVTQTAAERKAAAELASSQEKGQESAKKALDLVNDLKTAAGKKASVGVKGLTGGLMFGYTVPGTDAANYQAKFDSLKSLLTLENMGIMKGVLSDSDMKVISAASSAINRNMSEKEFDTQLSKVQNILEARIGNPVGEQDVTEILSQFGL